MKYTKTFKKAVLRKTLPPENSNIASVAAEMGVEQGSIYMGNQ